MEITMKELETSLSASINMLKGFAHNGKPCSGWHQVNDRVMEFRYSDNTYGRIKLDEIVGFNYCTVYDERHGREKFYRNVLTERKG